MRKRRLIWYFFPAFAVTLAAVLIVAGLGARRTRETLRLRTRERLLSVAQLIAAQLSDKDELPDRERLGTLCRRWADAAQCDVAIAGPDGAVLSSSLRRPGSAPFSANTPEIRAAILNGAGVAVRPGDVMVAAVSPRRQGRNPFVVRTALSLDPVEASVRGLRNTLLLAGLCIAAAAVLIGAVLSQGVAMPLRALRRGAENFARGDLSGRLPSSDIEEINVLADTMNRMAAQLNERIATIRRQRDEQEALLACMIEGVLAVDTQTRLLRLNRSARDLFHIRHPVTGQPEIASVIRNADLLRIVGETLRSNAATAGEIYLETRDRYLQAQGAALLEPDGRKIGAVIVLHDITQLRKLETMRRDFVANVSHELKTPITSIKGFTETLLDGAYDNRDNLERFLGIIRKQADRLQQIIEDLLILSRIEFDADSDQVEFAPAALNRVLENAVSACRTAADAARIEIALADTPMLRADVNVQLLEQAVVNLIDNAIKYSETGTSVEVSVEEAGDELVIRVADEGPGIAARHLPRLFERFYRVDRSRSRNLGGTGLGLAIVKRVAIAHGGRVDVRSEVGRGSVFSLYLPRSGPRNR